MRKLAGFIGFICFLALAGALYLQHYQGYEPCSICILQRVVFLAIMLTCLVYLVRPYTLLMLPVLILGIVGVTLSAELVSLEGGPPGCSMDKLAFALDNLGASTFMPWLFEPRALCSDPAPRILGLSLVYWSGALYSLICFISSFMLRVRKSERK